MTDPGPTRPADVLYPQRAVAIRSDKCIAPPIGCGGSATAFDNELSRREYAISGLCQDCQDVVFAPDREEER